MNNNIETIRQSLEKHVEIAESIYKNNMLQLGECDVTEESYHTVIYSESLLKGFDLAINTILGMMTE
jgi:hypothetical protein